MDSYMGGRGSLEWRVGKRQDLWKRKNRGDSVSGEVSFRQTEEQLEEQQGVAGAGERDCWGRHARSLIRKRRGWRGL